MREPVETKKTNQRTEWKFLKSRRFVAPYGGCLFGFLQLSTFDHRRTPAGTEYVFSFQTTNPSAAQSASRVYIAASGFVSAEMTTDTADLHGVTDGGSAETAAYNASLM